jgi:hypothetical protein
MVYFKSLCLDFIVQRQEELYRPEYCMSAGCEPISVWRSNKLSPVPPNPEGQVT